MLYMTLETMIWTFLFIAICMCKTLSSRGIKQLVTYG